MTPAQLAILKAEILADPLGRGYAGMDDQGIERSLNQPDREADREQITAAVLVGALDKAEYAGLIASDKAYFSLLVQAGAVEPTRPVRQQLRDLFPVGSKTRVEINKALKRPGSRAEEIELGRVSTSDIADAKRS